MELHFKVIGAILIVLALVHIIFPRYFNWVEELKPLSLINRQMMTTHTFFIALTVFLMGLLCFTSANELIVTDLGKKISLGFAVFWMIRLYFQFFGYSSELWKGKGFETIVHVLFSCLWSYLSVTFLIAYFN
jgi:ABC-type polysaccharide transport system permease subunit